MGDLNILNSTLGYTIFTTPDNDTDSEEITNVSSNALAKLCAQHKELCRFRVIIDVFIVASMCLFGFVGNILSIVVLRRSASLATISFLLQALAVADNVYLIACLFFQTLKSISECTEIWPESKMVYPLMEKYVWPFASIAQTTTVWMVILVTVDRYIAISKPLHSVSLCTFRRAKRAVLVIVIVAICYNIPRFFEHKIIYEVDRCTGRKRFFSVHSDFRKNYKYWLIYKTCMYFVFRIVLPMGTLIILNTKLITVLHRARKNRKEMTKSSKRRDNFTVILVAVVTVFIICQFPDFVLRTYVTIRSFFKMRSDLRISYINTLTNMLLTVNSSTNCIVYSLTGKRFRHILNSILFPSCNQSAEISDASCMNQDTQRYTSIRGPPTPIHTSFKANTQRVTTM